MGIVIFKKHHYLLLGAAASMASASAARRLTATCGLVLLAQVLIRTTCITIVALSARPTTITVSTHFQSAVLPDIFHIIIKKKNQDMCLFFFSCWFLSLGLSFPKESPITINFLLVQYGIAVNYVGADSNATWTTSGYNNAQANPLYTTRSGIFNGGSFGEQVSTGHLWSGTTLSGTSAYNLGYDSSNVYPTYDYRQRGFPVRCIAHKCYVMDETFYLRCEIYPRKTPLPQKADPSACLQ